MTQAGDEVRRLELQLETAPDDFPTWLELARLRNIARQSAGAFDAANNALTLRPSSLEALYERGVAQLELGMAGEAAAVFASLIAIQPLHPNVLVSLGTAYFQLRRLGEAGLIWEQAVRVAPDPVGILEDLAVCYQRLGEFQQVAETWERVLLLQPAHPQALHHLAALGRRPAPDISSPEYLVKLFGEFAEEFDATLGSLGYDGPRLLAELVAKNIPAAPGGWRILDAGCGTGLCAEHFRRWAGWLVGVDLSPEMLARAGERQLYDELHCAEITRFCADQRGAFDLIVAGDSINYFGNLKPVIVTVASSLRGQGRFAFFVERMDGESAAGFRLERHGRYSHQPAYVAGCLAAARLQILAREEAPIRSESGRPVIGTLFLAGP